MNVRDQNWAAVIVAAGRGERFGRPKQLLEVAGVPMVGWSVRTFAGMPEISDIVVATEEQWMEPMHALFEQLVPQRTVRLVCGGATRQQSVVNGLSAVPAHCTAVLVHDGARPLVLEGDVRAAMRVVAPGRGALLAQRVVDTVKLVDEKTNAVVKTLDRDRLWAAQTPQFATVTDMRRAHEHARRDGIEATDDAMLLERIGIEVMIVPSSSENFKVTLPADIARAEMLLRERAVEASP